MTGWDKKGEERVGGACRWDSFLSIQAAVGDVMIYTHMEYYFIISSFNSASVASGNYPEP